MGREHQRTTSAEPGVGASGTGWAPTDFGSNAEQADRLARRLPRGAPVGTAAATAYANLPPARPDPVVDLVRQSNPGASEQAPGQVRGAVAAAQGGRLDEASAQVEAGRTAMTARWGADGSAAADTLSRQVAVSRQIQAATGRVVNGAPSEEDLRAWFRTMNHPERRGQAEQAYRDYTSAYLVHTGHVPGRPDDIEFTRRSVPVGGFDADGRAVAGGQSQVTGPTSIGQVLDPSRGTGVSHGGARLGQVATDCQGYAYLSDQLMREAGYEVSHVVGNGPAGAHAMTTLTDPAHPDRAPRVQSNGEFYASAEEGYRSGTQVVAGRNVGQIDTRFVRGATLDEAEARNRLANPNAR